MYKNKAKKRVETKQKKTKGQKKPNKGNRGTVLLTVFWSLFSRHRLIFAKINICLDLRGQKYLQNAQFF